MRGRRGDKAYTSTHGGDGRSPQVSKLRAMERGQVSVQQRVVGPSQAEMLRAVRNGECPFCGRKFANIAVHTNRTHGIDRFQLKDMLGIPKSHSICTPELRDKLAERSRRWLADNPDIKEKLRAKGNRRTFSKAGRAVQRQKALALPPEVVKRIGADNTAARRAASAERDREIVAMVQAGATMPDIRERMGVSNAVIKDALKFYGIDIDMRTRRANRVPPEQLDKAKRAREAYFERLAEKRLARWAELGKDYAAVHTCAAEWNVGVGVAAGYLRKHGEHVPDGRSRR